MIRFTTASVFLIAALAPAQQHSAPAHPPATPQGQVLFHRSDDQPQQEPQAAKAPRTPETTIATITDGERSALLFTGWDLDLHMTPATSHVAARARFTVRNTSSKPLTRLTLQLSSTLQWESVASDGPLKFTEHTIATDADHSGGVSEALVTLAKPLAPGESLKLTAIYSGTLPATAARLTRIGAPPEQAIRADWDAISPEMIALRGFGNVIWYPVSGPALFLGDGAKLFQAVGGSRLAQERSEFHVRLTVEYVGEPPVDAFLNGKRLVLTHSAEEPNTPVDQSHGVAIADSGAAPLGFRTPSLFVTWNASRPSEDKLLSVITSRPEAIGAYNAAADDVAPLLREWLGESPLEALTLIDHAGQPFEDNALLSLPLTTTDAKQISPSLVHSMAHAWFRSSLPWLNEGVPQMMAILQSEAVDGRDQALAGLRGLLNPLTLVEPEANASEARPATSAPEAETAAQSAQRSSIPFDPRNLPGPPENYSSSSSSSSNPSTRAEDQAPPQPLPSTLPPPPGQPGQSLIAAHDEIYYRAKAAAVLFMLRSVIGDVAMKQSLQMYRTYARKATAENPEDPRAFQRVVEEASHKDLGWLFDDWVYNDRGLADLSIVSVTPRNLPARNGKDTSWLVAVEVRNAGAVAVEVPVTVRSGTLTSTVRVRVAPQSTLSTRVVFEGTPAEVVLNDGTVPETTAPLHTRELRLAPATP
jgi:hypothetical protein